MRIRSRKWVLDLLLHQDNYPKIINIKRDKWKIFCKYSILGFLLLLLLNLNFWFIRSIINCSTLISRIYEVIIHNVYPLSSPINTHSLSTKYTIQTIWISKQIESIIYKVIKAFKLLQYILCSFVSSISVGYSVRQQFSKAFHPPFHCSPQASDKSGDEDTITPPHTVRKWVQSDRGGWHPT